MASVDENADGGVVTAVTTENADEISVDDERFEVAGGNLKLKDGMDLDFESDTSPIEVTITATAAGDNATHTVSVSINDANDAPEITVAAMTTDDAMAAGVDPDLTVSEGSDGSVPDGVVAHIALSDQDSGDTHTLTVSDDRFETIEAFGQWWLKLKAGAELDYETEPTITVTVTVMDDGEPAMSTESTPVTIMVTDANDAPMIAVADGETPDGMPASSTVDENVAGAILGAITFSDEDEGQMHTLSTSDDRFVTKQDAEGGWWLALADGVSLDHEAEDGSVMVTVTVTDDGDPAMSASADVTITVNDVNEAPTVTGTVDPVTAESGEDIKAKPIDLLALFTDQDEGDAPVRYEMSGSPSWLKFSVEYGEDDDGNDTAHGIVSGEAPTTGADSDSAHKVTLTAADGDGAEVSTSFYVIIDDGNDVITDIVLSHNPDDDGNEARNVNYVVDVDENDASGVVFGRITVEDQDHAMHPNGMHMVTVDNDSFEIRVDAEGGLWLAMKAGESLDHDKGSGYVTVTVQAADLNGAKDAKGNFKDDVNVLTQEITVNINDVNEAPMAKTIGNWWVTVNSNLVASEVTEGSWLSFELETTGVYAAFTDPEMDDLEYSMSSGPAWLQIDKDGKITNKAGVTPNRGSYRVEVTATDEDGESASESFMLYVAESAVVDDDRNVSNRGPVISLTTGSAQYTEGSSDRRIATIRAEDDDQDLTGHPFAISKVEIVSVVNLNNPGGGDTNNVPDATAQGALDQGYAAAFRLGNDPDKSGDTLTYSLHVMDTDKGKDDDTTDILNHEDVRDIRLVVRVTDGLGKTSDVTVDVRINDANEAPEAVAANRPSATDLTVEQSAEEKSLIHINLYDLWEDPDINDFDGNLTFTATTSTSWIKILHGPARWESVQRGPDGILGGDNDADDVEWDGTPPDPTDYVVIVEIDRTGKNNDQVSGGSFTLTARDDGSPAATGTYEAKVTVTDENLLVPDEAGAVSISGGSNPREGGRLTPSFNEAKDPDLAGSASAALVVYTWQTHEDQLADGEPDTQPGAGTTIMVTTSNAPLTLTQAHVGKFISVSVNYYEVHTDSFTASQSGGSDVTDNAVADSQDRGTAHFNILTNGETLTAEVRIKDDDGLPAVPSTVTNEYPDADGDGTNDYVTYTWEKSDNGRGGWETVDSDDLTNDLTLALSNGNGKHYRLVATYTDDAGGSERHASHAVQVSDLPSTARSAPQPTGSPNPGGTLSVNASGASVQWQKLTGGNWLDIPGATGSLGLTSGDAGSQVRALITYQSNDTENPGATAIVATPTQSIGGSPASGADPVTVKADHYIEGSVSVAHAARSGAAPGLTASIEETVDLRSLFQDPDSPRLTFTVTSPLSGAVATGDDETLHIANEQGVLVFEERTGTLTYISDVTHGHDGDSTGDGDGNLLTLAVSASDGGGTPATANVHLRLNVAPTGINFSDDSPEIQENGRGNEELVAVLNVQDENMSGSVAGQDVVPGHKFGTHNIDIHGDDRFIITKTDNEREDGDGDGSTWDLRVKKGATFDVDKDDMDKETPGTQIVLTFTATDGGGLSTPVPTSTNGYSAIRLVITITDDPEEVDPPRPADTDVPGLKDDETDNDNNDLEDGADPDNDGGSLPPPPGMSIGFIEDFVENAGGLDQDLLEDFMLIIDDGIDIA